MLYQLSHFSSTEHHYLEIPLLMVVPVGRMPIRAEQAEHANVSANASPSQTRSALFAARNPAADTPYQDNKQRPMITIT
jgi:hypothetical protein